MGRAPGAEVVAKYGGTVSPRMTGELLRVVDKYREDGVKAISKFAGKLDKLGVPEAVVDPVEVILAAVWRAGMGRAEAFILKLEGIGGVENIAGSVVGLATWRAAKRTKASPPQPPFGRRRTATPRCRRSFTGAQRRSNGPPPG